MLFGSGPFPCMPPLRASTSTPPHPPLWRHFGGCPLTAAPPHLVCWLGLCRLKRAKIEDVEASVSPFLHMAGLPECTQPTLLALAQWFGPGVK